MPSPNFLDWCNIPISSINKSIYDLIHIYSKTQFDKSPFIAAIQSLKGKSAGEKLKDINFIVQSIVQNSRNKGEFAAENEFREVSPAMLSYIQTLVGVKLKVNEIIVNALKLNDVKINNVALRAHWFFYGNNDHINVENFINNILPFVSLNTRIKIIKKLSHSLEGFPNKAQEFFNVFVELYDINVCLPILTACPEIFIYEKILQLKIKLPTKILNVLFKKYPNLVIKYLQLGNKNKLENEKDRDRLSILIHDYDYFIPQLIQNYPKDFVELYEITPEKSIKLGKKLSDLFLKNLKADLIEKPNIFLKLLSNKSVKNCLSEKEFALIMEKLIPVDENNFCLDSILEYCNYFPESIGLYFLKTKYKYFYDKNLLDNKMCLNSPEFIRLITNSEREKLIKNFLNKHVNNSEFLNSNMCYLPPNEVIPALKIKMRHAVDSEERAKIIAQMIKSCSLYQSKDNLLKVLEFFNIQYKNEGNSMLKEFFQCLCDKFDIKSLNNNHWSVLREIIFSAYVKKDLFTKYISLTELLLEEALRNALGEEKNNQALLDKLFDILLEFKVEHSYSTYNILVETEYERKYLKKFLKVIPIKYPEHHEIWEEQKIRTGLVLNFIKSINNYNTKNHIKRKKILMTNLQDNNSNEIKIETYPWLVKLTDEFFQNKLNELSVRKKIVLKLIKRNAPALYEEKMDKYSNIRSIESGEALQLLQGNHKKILENWEAYLIEARKLLYFGKKSAKRFVSATKWYHEIPVKFIDSSLHDIKEKGSLNILAILLETPIFEEIIIPFIPESEKLNLNLEDVKTNYELTQAAIKAMKDLNSPVSFETIEHFSFCKDHYKFLNNVLNQVAQYAPANKVIEYAIGLLDNNTPLKKQAFRLLQNVATKSLLRQILEQNVAKESDASVRHLISKLINNLFLESPKISNFNLMKTCIDSLTIHDEKVMRNFSDIEKIDNSYLTAYIEIYLNKIESGFDSETRFTCLKLFFENLDKRVLNYIPEDFIEAILKKYFFDADSIEMSRIARNFAIRTYLLQSGNKFMHRLNIIIQILKGIMENFDVPHAKKPRFYAANYTLQQFFDDMLMEISNSDNVKNLEIIDNMLTIFNSTLSIWQEPSSYLSLNLFKEYLLTKTPEAFGIKCAHRIFDLIREFSKNEAIADEIAKCLQDFIDRKIYKQFFCPNIKLSIINGLLKEDLHYANLVAIKLLDYNEVSSYDSRYDDIIKILKKKPNVILQCNLHRHLNFIPSDYNDM